MSYIRIIAAYSSNLYGFFKMLNRVRLTLADVVVVVILWSMEFFNIWVDALCAYTSFVIFTRAQLESNYFQFNDWILFVIQCSGAMVLAFYTDVGRIRKMTACLIGVGIFALTPFVALLTTMVESLWSGMIMFWPSLFLFITLPLAYCLMFNQKLYADCGQVRRIVSVLEMLNACVGWIAFSTLPEYGIDGRTRYSVVFMWVLTIPLLVALLTSLDSIRRFIRGDISLDLSVKSLIEGIRNDWYEPHHGGRSARHVVLFGLMLLPSLSLSALGSTLESISNEDGEPQDPLLKNLLFLFQLLIIPFIEVCLTMTQISDEKADYSILILAHATNVIVLVLIVTSLVIVSPENDDNSQRGTSRIKRDVHYNFEFLCPVHDGATYVALNGVNGEIILSPDPILEDIPKNTKMTAGTLLPGTKIMDTYQYDTRIEIRMVEPVKVEATKRVRLLRNRFNLLYTIGNLSFLDLKVYFQPHHFNGRNALILILSTMWLDVAGGKVTINANDGGFNQIVDVLLSNAVKETLVPVPSLSRKVKFTYTYTGTDEVTKKILNEDSVDVNLEPYDVVVVFVLLAGIPAEVVLNSLRVCKQASPPPTEPTTKTTARRTTTQSTTKKPPRRATPEEISTYALAGAAFGTTSVAYTHFFWMESPLRLRATMFAAFRVANAVVWKFTPLLTGGTLTQSKAYGLLTFQILTLIAHLILGWIFQSKYNP
ncbi:hypothetical protein GE061_016269 [Apolygus lucorum]|uniref:Uncharacterized protein n=1 Tax=Apolygus lucorum TaxID=248454 RepID=A0A8S9XFI4_APOLU|nr:hypothetical protein GE061_016269 [Apolygus lucorum]